MSIFFDCFLVFIFGAVFEGACVFWMHFLNENKPIKAALFSMLIATSQLVGIVASVKTLIVAPFFVLGYGAGTYGAAIIKIKGSSK